MLLCDFHIHTRYSDGAVELRKTVDLFGQAGFDAIAITDHVVNGDSSFGKLAHRFRFTVNEDNYETYADHVRQEAERAWDKYGMLIIPGVEISKNYISSDKSAHFLILDIKEFIPACWSYEKIFLEGYALSLSDLGAKLASTPYAGVWERAVRALTERETFIDLERGSEDFLMTYLRRARYMVFGPEPVYAYGLAKKRELFLVRMVVSGKIYEIPAAVLKERISETYV